MQVGDWIWEDWVVQEVVGGGGGSWDKDNILPGNLRSIVFTLACLSTSGNLISMQTVLLEHVESSE